MINTNRCEMKYKLERNAQRLMAAVRLGNIAKKQIAQYENAILHARQYAEYNRYDRDAVTDAECEIAKYEYKIAALQSRCNEAVIAKHKLDNFNRASNARQIKKLRAEYDKLDVLQTHLENRMFACEVNMDATYRDDDTCASAASDMAHYAREYDEVTAKMREISVKLAGLQQTK